MGCSAGDPEVETQAMGLEVDDAEFAARSRAANFASMRGRLKLAAQTELDEIRARLPDDLIVYSSTTSASQVLGTGGGDLLPASCRSLLGSEPPDYEAAARCFIASKPSLLLDGPDADRGPAPEFVVVSNEAGGRTDAAEHYLGLEQRHHGYVVEGRSIALVFIDGRLVSSSGRYAGSARFQAPAVDLPRLEAASRVISGREATSLGLAYNPASGELEFAFHDGRDEHRLNVADGARRGSKPMGHALEVNKNIYVYQFPSSVYLGYGSTTSLISSPVSCTNGSPGTCDGGGSGTCRYSPRQSSVVDRVNSIHVTYNTTPPNETPVYEDDPCGSTSVFTQSPWTSQYSLQHYAASARRNLDEVADIMQHSESFFWVYPRTASTILRLNTNAWTGFTPAGEYTPSIYGATGTKINLKQQPSPSGWSYARHFDTIIHEFGHYWHDTYGYKGAGQVLEGWGDHFPLRAAIHKRFVTGAWSALGYLTEINHPRGHRIARTLRKGEWVADQSPPAFDPMWLSYPSSYCPNDWYTCGALLGVTYWLLAFDTCRINYNGCTNGADIIRFNGGYQNSAWRLVNSAYAYAIKEVSPAADIGEFHTHVATRYAQFYSSGYIDLADLNRVNAALGAHCLGPAADCAGRHRLPGSTLPSLHTEKDALFYEAEDAVLYSGATAGGVPESASSDAYVSFGSTGEAWFAVNPPQTGAYRIHFVIKPKNASYDQVSVRDPVTGIWRLVGALNQPWYGLVWDWRSRTDGTADVTFNTTGSQWLAFKTAPSHTSFILDAIWLEKL